MGSYVVFFKTLLETTQSSVITIIMILRDGLTAGNLHCQGNKGPGTLRSRLLGQARESAVAKETARPGQRRQTWARRACGEEEWPEALSLSPAPTPGAPGRPASSLRLSEEDSDWRLRGDVTSAVGGFPLGQPSGGARGALSGAPRSLSPGNCDEVG